MKVGFLSVTNKTVDEREAAIRLFDHAHTADMFMTVAPENVDAALGVMRSACDAIVIDGDVSAFYDLYKDTLSSRPDHFELDGKHHSVVRTVTGKWLSEKFIPIIGKKVKKRYATVVFKTYGKPEDELRSILKEFTGKKSKITLGFFPDFMECEIHARCPANMAKEDMNELSFKLDELLGSCTYAYERVSIEQTVAQILTEEGLQLKVAESFTGGAIAAALTANAGASVYLNEGIVAYSVSSKNKRLGVPLEVIAERGAVSGDTAYGMVIGLLNSGDCDVALATTGNAGPSAQNGAVGQCYIAIGIAGGKSVPVIKYIFGGDREFNIRSGVKNAMFLLYESLISFRAQRTRLTHQQQAGGAE